MDNRTNVVRNNAEGFGYSFTATVDILKRNPHLTPEAIQHHFDFIIGMALTDLLTEESPAAIEINKNMLDLKYRLLPRYNDLLQAVLSAGEKEADKKNNRAPIKEVLENPKAEERNEEMIKEGKKLIDLLLLEIASFRKNSKIPDKEISLLLGAMSHFFANPNETQKIEEAK